MSVCPQGGGGITAYMTRGVCLPREGLPVEGGLPHEGICLHQGRYPLPPPPTYGQLVGGTYPTGMQSCYLCIHVHARIHTHTHTRTNTHISTITKRHSRTSCYILLFFFSLFVFYGDVFSTTQTSLMCSQINLQSDREPRALSPNVNVNQTKCNS